MKKWITLFLLAILTLSLLLTGCGNSSEKDANATPMPEATQQPETDPAPSDAPDESIKSGRYTLPCGVEVNFSSSVRNDKTGNWKLSSTSDSAPIMDYAIEYYETMFSSDDEVHAVWNATLGTMTRITAGGNLLYIDTFEYVKGEEHNADILFTGESLDSEVIDLETGNPLED